MTSLSLSQSVVSMSAGGEPGVLDRGVVDQDDPAVVELRDPVDLAVDGQAIDRRLAVLGHVDAHLGDAVAQRLERALGDVGADDRAVHANDVGRVARGDRGQECLGVEVGLGELDRDVRVLLREDVIAGRRDLVRGALAGGRARDRLAAVLRADQERPADVGVAGRAGTRAAAAARAGRLAAGAGRCAARRGAGPARGRGRRAASSAAGRHDEDERKGRGESRGAAYGHRSSSGAPGRSRRDGGGAVAAGARPTTAGRMDCHRAAVSATA